MYAFGAEPLVSNLMEDDLDFDEIEKELAQYGTDPHVKRAIQSPKDIPESASSLDKQIRKIEAESVEDCIILFILTVLPKCLSPCSVILLCRCERRESSI